MDVDEEEGETKVDPEEHKEQLKKVKAAGYLGDLTVPDIEAETSQNKGWYLDKSEKRAKKKKTVKINPFESIEEEGSEETVIDLIRKGAERDDFEVEDDEDEGLSARDIAYWQKERQDRKLEELGMNVPFMGQRPFDSEREQPFEGFKQVGRQKIDYFDPFHEMVMMNPGSFDEITEDSHGAEPFEGFHFSWGKWATDMLSVGHNMSLPRKMDFAKDLSLEEQEKVGYLRGPRYSFSAEFEFEDDDGQGEISAIIDSDWFIQAEYADHIGPVNFAVETMVPPEKYADRVPAELSCRFGIPFPSWTPEFWCSFNPFLYSISFLQAVTPRLDLGLELVHLPKEGVAGISFAMRYVFGFWRFEALSNLSDTRLHVTRDLYGGLSGFSTNFYLEREKVGWHSGWDIGATLENSDTEVSFAINNHLELGLTCDLPIFEAVGCSFSLDIDHWNQKYKFGVGMGSGCGQPEATNDF